MQIHEESVAVHGSGKVVAIRANMYSIMVAFYAFLNVRPTAQLRGYHTSIFISEIPEMAYKSLIVGINGMVGWGCKTGKPGQPVKSVGYIAEICG